MTRYCTRCDIECTNIKCPRCDMPTSRNRDGEPEVPRTSTFVSDPDASVDTMVEQASRPSLASLVMSGIKKGLITVMPDYATRKNS